MSPETPLDATGIARRHFPTVRRGYEPAEVRAFLHELADLVGRLQRGEAHERERAQRAESRAELAEDLDQHRLVELLGEETARVLDAARDAARDIRSKAEEAAARMVREAQETGRGIVEQAEQDAAVRKLEILADAAELRREAEAEVERCRAEGRILVDEMRAEANAEREHMIAQGERARSEAEADAEALRATAREQGQALVSEAQAVREHMLGDLARRRRTAREQLERLSAARDRLLNAYGVVRRTLDEATTELDVVLPEAKAAAELAVRRVHDEPEPTAEQVEAELTVARLTGMVGDRGAQVLAAVPSDDAPEAPPEEGDEGEAGGDSGGSATAAGGEGAAAVAGNGHGPVAAEADTGAGDASATPGDAGETGAGDTDSDADGDAAETDAEVVIGGAAGTDAAGADADVGAAPDEAATEREADPADGRHTQPHGERWGLWPFRRRTDAAADAGGVPTHDPAGAGAIAGAEAGGPSAPGVVEPAAVAALPFDAAVDDAPDRAGASGDVPAEAGPDRVGDAPPPDHAASSEADAPDHGRGRVDALFAQIRAVRDDEPAPGEQSNEQPGDEPGDDASPLVAAQAGAHRAPRGPEPAGVPADGGEPLREGKGAAVGTLERGGAHDTGPASDVDELDHETDAEADTEADTEADHEAAAEADDVAERLLARDVVLADPERELSRRLKRVLADEQNEVFDLLRRGKVASADEVLPASAQHADRYAKAGLADLDTAARAGSDSVGGRSPGPCLGLATELGQALVEPMRERIDRSFDECGGDVEEVTERLRSMYREWKGQRISEVVRHFTAAAFAWGAYESAPRGTDLVWLVDRTCEPCPDADDNALAGRVRKGRRFPTGDRCAPAHPGCRCLVVPAD